MQSVRTQVSERREGRVKVTFTDTITLSEAVADVFRVSRCTISMRQTYKILKL